MKLKNMKLLMIASIIDICLGVFLVICGVLEAVGVIVTRSNTSITAGGILLSHLVFVSGVLVLISGGFTLLKRNKMGSINLQILLGAAALAWPLFVSIALFFSQRIICIRLVPTILTSLFYITSILIVKIRNEELKKTHKFNPQKHLNAMGKRKSGVNVAGVLQSHGKSKARSSHSLNTASFMSKFKTKKKLGGGRMFSGSRRKSGGIRLHSRFK